MNERILLTAGGTGGHIFPAVAAGKKLNENVILATDKRFGNYQIDSAGIEVRFISSAKMDITNPLFMIKTLLGVFQSIGIILKSKVRVVVGFGGYPSFPVLIAAVLLGRKIILHEQNAYLGRVNRFFIRFADILATSFEKTYRVPNKHKSKVVFTGNPIRENFVKNSDIKKSDEFHIFVIGGSQGAKSFSEIIPEAVGKNIKITQQCRKDDLELARTKYQSRGIKAELSTFFTNVNELLQQADLVIARAGASTITEIAALKVPAILVPYPYAMDNHQFFNAKNLAEKDAAILIEHKDFTVEKLRTILSGLIQNKEKLANLAENIAIFAQLDAADNLAKLIEKI